MASPQIIGNTVTENWSLYCGGGVFLQFSGDTYIEKCLIYANETQYGAGIDIQTSPGAVITNCTISDNHAAMWAGGMMTASFSYPTLLNTIVYGNIAGEMYPNMFSAGDDSFIVSYSDIGGGWIGEGNIDSDPLFVDPGNGDFNLSWANYPLEDSTKSPCIDAGNPEQVYNDPDGTRNDLGAFYFAQNISAIEDLVIVCADSSVVLTWGAVLWALEYRVYISDNPYFIPAGEPDTVIYAPDTSAVIGAVISDNKMYFQIISGN